ncbi:MAG: hypothetical protein KME27_28920 [Lyngbya sp. HA4199-MV5]|nr:hypothetical protein [Lyngbya sp. HA4199-MV5]
MLLPLTASAQRSQAPVTNPTIPVSATDFVQRGTTRADEGDRQERSSSSPFPFPFPFPPPSSLLPLRFFHPTPSRGVKHGQCILKRVNIASLRVKGTGVKWDESLFQQRTVGEKTA